MSSAGGERRSQNQRDRARENSPPKGKTPAILVIGKQNKRKKKMSGV